jgi:hypothetical protein
MISAVGMHLATGSPAKLLRIYFKVRDANHVDLLWVEADDIEEHD